MYNEITGSFEPLTESKINEAEKRIGQAIPMAYRKFLLEHNGGHPEPSDFKMSNAQKGMTETGTVKKFLGIDGPEKTLNLDYTLETFRDRMPTDLFPVARDPGGNLICIFAEGPNKEKVYFWDHEMEAEEGQPPTETNLSFIANNFDEFLKKLGDV